MTLITAIAGGAALLGNIISGFVGAKQQSKTIDKQIAAQKAENAATREHNLQLAHLQNSMNIDQWKRENKYNSPAAQMARFQAAGLNPNLIYGQSNTSGQISGSLTSGAPATPTDMSALGYKSSGLASAFKAVGDAAMQIPMYREQVRGMKLDNDSKAMDLKEQEYQQTIRRFVRGLNYSPESLESLLNFGAGNNDWQSSDGVDPLYNNPDVRKYLMEYAKYHDGFRISKETADAFIEKAINEAQISADEAKKARQTLQSTINAINRRNANEIDFSELEKTLGVSKSAISIIKLIVEAFK